MGEFYKMLEIISKWQTPTDVIPVDSHRRCFRNCLNAKTDADHKVRLPKCKLIVGVTITRTNSRIHTKYFVLFLTPLYLSFFVAQTDGCAVQFLHSVTRCGTEWCRLLQFRRDDFYESGY
jgi:hypothetical protein